MDDRSDVERLRKNGGDHRNEFGSGPPFATRYASLQLARSIADPLCIEKTGQR